MNLTLPGHADLFTLHVRQEVGTLERLTSWLGYPGVAKAINETMLNRYLTRIADHKRELLALLPAGAATVDTTVWEALEPPREEAAKLRKEVFALVQGILFNEAALDGRLVEVARHLLAGLSRRSNLEDVVVPTVSPESESLNRTLELVRLRIPSQAVWELPICVHEFGHHVARTLGAARSERSDKSPIEIYLKGEAAFEAQLTASTPEVARSRLHELFADAYATYAHRQLGRRRPGPAVHLARHPHLSPGAGRVEDRPPPRRLRPDRSDPSRRGVDGVGVPARGQGRAGATSGPHPSRSSGTTPVTSGRPTPQLSSSLRSAPQLLGPPRFSLARRTPGVHR